VPVGVKRREVVMLRGDHEHGHDPIDRDMVVPLYRHEENRGDRDPAA
jgi:hypothetical protein